MKINYEETYLENLEFMRKYYPGFTENIVKTDISNIDIIEDSDGSIKNIKYKNEELYPDYPEVALEIQTKNFLNNPNYYAMLPFMNYENRDMHDKYINNILTKSPLKNESGNYIFEKHYTSKDEFNLLIVHGIGAGFHIKYLLENVKIYNLIIIDKTLEFLKLSLHLLDWTSIFEYFSRDGYSFNIITEENPEILANKVLNTFFRTNPINISFFYSYEHLNSNHFKESLQFILDKGILITKGWGFYDDELQSLMHTLGNIKNSYPILTVKKSKEKDLLNTPLFITGAGPSIDNDIDFIKKNQNKVIIFSCGTSLKILHDNGITPDFHLEIERPYLTYEVLTKTFSREYLKKLNIIGLNTLHPEVMQLFNEAYMFFRENDTGASFSDDSIKKVSIVNPTVVNAAVSLGVMFNFKNIYLFGVDMGFKDSKNHHSKSSIYHDDKSIYKVPEKLNPKEFTKLEGNFGGEISTTDLYLWAKQQIESSLSKKNINTNVYNCSDGSKIKFTFPKHSTDLEILKNELEFYSDISKVRNKFENLDNKNIYNLNEIRKELFTLLKNINLIQEALKKRDKLNLSNYYLFLQHIQEYIKESNEVTKKLIGSTIMVMSSIIFSHTNASDNIEKKEKFIKDSVMIIYDFLEFAKKDIKNIISNLN